MCVCPPAPPPPPPAPQPSLRIPPPPPPPRAQVSIGTNKARFSSAVDKSGRITVAGCVKSGAPFLTKIGTFDIDLGIEVGQL